MRETRYLYRRPADRPALPPEEFVLEEMQKCERVNLTTDPPAVLARHLQKVYKNTGGGHTVAVDDISFVVDKGGCFGLLGTNGAGKSTTFKMLTQDVSLTKGEIYINGKDLAQNFPLIRKQIGK